VTRAVSRHETRAVAVLALGFGLVGIDRFLIVTMFPVIARDLKLGYGDIGSITGALAIAWAIAALFMGNMSDRIGRRRVLVGALILFSLLIGASGLAVGLGTLMLVRIVMGLADGAFTPASISATIEASSPGNQGRNIGIQQMTLTLFGLGLSPLLVTALLHTVNWRYIFVIFLVPGLLLAWATSRVVPPRPPTLGTLDEMERSSFADWKAVLAYRNIRLLMGGMFCWLTCLVTTSAFLPNYLLDHLHLDFGRMGTVMSAIGFGAAAGSLVLPWLSDRWGRRAVMILGVIGAEIALFIFSHLGADTGPLFAVLFTLQFFTNALITMTVGPICADTVPPALLATASGVIIAVGELVGGGLAPILAGQMAERFGMANLLWLPMAAMAVGLVLCVFLRRDAAGNAFSS
jgi:predicted MFS family arabinose efflux permease